MIFEDLHKAYFDCDLVLASCGRIDLNKDSFFGSSEIYLIGLYPLKR